MKQSSLTFYSYGVVAANKPLSSMNIQVSPLEDLPMMNGELTDNLSTDNVKGQDADGAAFETVVHTSATLTARWLPFSSNRKTAPDVRRGEKVAIYKFSDADKYYWSSLEYEAKLRKLETVIYAFSNTQDEEADAEADNTYYLEISTHTKQIRLHTSTSDGEPVGFDFVLNTKDATFQFLDTLENVFFLDSLSKRFVLKNAEECFVDLNARDLFINVPGDMSIKVGGKFSIVAQGGLYVQAPAGTQFVTPKLSTSEVLQTGGDVVCGGSLSIARGMTTGASGEGDGHISLNGNIEASGTAKFVGEVTADRYYGDGSTLSGI